MPTDDSSSKLSRGKLSITLDRGVSRLSEQWSNELTESIRPLLELPGVGLSAGEFALQNFVAACKATTVELDGKLRESATRRNALFTAVQSLGGRVRFGRQFAVALRRPDDAESQSVRGKIQTVRRFAHR